MRLFKIVEAKGEQDKLLVLKPFVGSDENPKFFIHFGFIDRVGINPQSKFDTPNGVYAYPLTQEIFDLLLANKLPFANDRPYLHVISCERPIVNLKNYSQEDLMRDSSFVQRSKLMSGTDMWNAMMTAKNKTPAGQMWNITRIAAHKDKNKWNALFRKMGYAGFYDPGLSIIHESEPTQLVIVETSAVIRVKTMINPYARLNNQDMSDRQDRNHVQKIIEKNKNPYNHDEMSDTNNKILLKLKEFFDSEEISFFEMANNIELIINNFEEMEIRILITRAVDNIMNPDERTRKDLILRIIYHEAYKPDAQVYNLSDFIVYYKPGDEKYIPVQSLTNAVNSLGDGGLENVIQSAKHELKFDAESNKMFNLLKKVLDRKQSQNKGGIIKSRLVDGLSQEEKSGLLNFSPSKPLTEGQLSFLKKLDANKHFIDTVVNDDGFYKELGGKDVNVTGRKELIEDAIVFMKLGEIIPGFNGFDGKEFAFFLNDNKKLAERLRKSDFLFKMCHGGEHVFGRSHRDRIIKIYIEETINP